MQNRKAILSLFLSFFFMNVAIGAMVPFDVSMRRSKNTDMLKNPDSWATYQYFKNVYHLHVVRQTAKGDQKKIPTLFHYVWLGSEVPAEFRKYREGWIKNHPDWTFIFWTDSAKNYDLGDHVVTSFDEVEQLRADTSNTDLCIVVDVKNLDFENKVLFDEALNYGERADILRWEVMYRFGGVSIDVDMECLQPLDDLHYRYDFYAGLQPLDTGAVQLGTALFAACPHHPIVNACREGIKNNTQLPEIAERTGALHFTKSYMQTECGDFNNIVFPASYFYPCAIGQCDQARDSWFCAESFAVHHWARSWMKKEGWFKKKPAFHENPIVVIIPSFNNMNYFQKNIDSVLMQKYDNYQVLYIDDCSTDGMSPLVEAYIKEHDTQQRWEYVRNWHNCGALSNLYFGIHQYPDDVIIVNLDGDDWFKDEHVLARVNEEYQDPDVWLAYSQFEYYPNIKPGYGQDLSPKVRNNLYQLRQHCVYATALRTFRAWLFKKIKREDLNYQGAFFSITWDHAIMAPMLEMASPDHFTFIPDVLYVYNCKNPINDYKLHGGKQYEVAKHIYKMTPYQPLDQKS